MSSAVGKFLSVKPCVFDDLGDFCWEQARGPLGLQFLEIGGGGVPNEIKRVGKTDMPHT